MAGHALTVFVDRDDRFPEAVVVRGFNTRKYPTVNAVLDTLIPKVLFNCRRFSSNGRSTVCPTDRVF